MDNSGHPPLPVRKHPAHGVLEPWGKPVIVFLTICTKDRTKWLADEDVRRLLVSVWQEATAWVVGRYVIMPDHIHLFAARGDQEISLDSWISYWKSLFSKRHGNPAHRWQTDHWDTRLRLGERYEQKWEYVRANPVRQGLVAEPHEWPFQGELSELSWQGAP